MNNGARTLYDECAGSIIFNKYYCDAWFNGTIAKV